MTNQPVDVVFLANSLVFDSEGRTLKLGQVWQSGPAILVFLRHFACIACRSHAAQVWAEKQKYQQNGARLVFIGNGQPHFIKAFKEDLGLEDAVILTDPSLDTFRAAGLRNGYLAVIQLKSALNALKLLYSGHIQTAYSKEAGTHWQLGGIVAMSPAGRVLYRFASQALGDLPRADIETIALAEFEVQEPIATTQDIASAETFESEDSAESVEPDEPKIERKNS